MMILKNKKYFLVSHLKINPKNKDKLIQIAFNQMAQFFKVHTWFQLKLQMELYKILLKTFKWLI